MTTIDEAKTEAANALNSASRKTGLQSFAGLEEGRDPVPAVIVEREALRTLLAHTADYDALKGRLEEAVKLMQPFADAAENLDDTDDFDTDELWEHAAAMGLHVGEIRALAAFVDRQKEPARG
jgi:hypothetical protein